MICQKARLIPPFHVMEVLERAAKFKLEIKPGQIIVTSGTSPALLLVFMSLLEQGDEVIMSNPYYACYPNFVEYSGGEPIFIHTHEACGFNLEPYAVE